MRGFLRQNRHGALSHRVCLKWVTVVIAAVWGVLASLGPAAAQSLWPYRDPQRVFLFADTSARHVGDLITVVVRESTDVANKDQRNMDKSSEAAVQYDFASSSSGGGSASAQLDTSANSSRAFDGSSQLSVEQDFSDRITVPVIDILPNGNLVIGGKRCRRVAGETRTLVVSGIIRPLDVRPDNTIHSQYVANFKIYYEGDGPESHFTNQGWFGRVVNKVWPF